MPAVAISRKAGAHGELTGMLAIKAAHDAAGLPHVGSCSCPKAHMARTPPTAAFMGYSVKTVAAKPDGTVAAADVKGSARA